MLTVVKTLERFVENIYVADGPVTHAVGFPFPTRMIIVRLDDGRLWANSPVSVAPVTLGQVKALGPVSYLVAPTKLHVWRLQEWHRLFPRADLWAPPQIPTEFQDLPFAGRLQGTPPPAWSHDLDQLVFRGNFFVQEVSFFHRVSRTLILADFIQTHRSRAGHPLFNLLLRLSGIAYPKVGVPLDIRLSFTDRKLARRSLAQLLSWDFEKLILAHGICIERDAKALVEHAFRWLSAVPERSGTAHSRNNFSPDGVERS